MELGLPNHWRGQYFTPYPICKSMSAITLGDAFEEIKKKGVFSICDPACGSGAMLIASANHIAEAFQKDHSSLRWQDHVLLVGQDIDLLVGMMSYIQLSMIGCTGFVKIGDSLSDPIYVGDDLTNYWFTPAYCAVMRMAEHAAKTAKDKPT